MPREYREIAFSKEEVAAALTEYARSLGSNAPLIRAENLAVSETDDAVVTVRFGYETRAYTGPEVTAALIRYARKIGLPIARASRKAISAGDEEITLKLWIG